MKGLKIVKWEKGAPWPEVIEWRDQGEFSSETHYQKYGWCWRDYLNEMTIYFANDKGNRMRFTKRQLEGSLNAEMGRIMGMLKSERFTPTVKD